MVHPRLTSMDGSQTAWLASIAPYGAWGDLAWTTRFGEGACGMFEASWSMPLPPGFEHPLLRRGTRVELMDNGWRIGSSLVLTEPARGTGYDDPWRLTATGVGREVEGENAWYMVDGSYDASVTASVAIDNAISEGLPWAGRDSTIPTIAFGEVQDSLQTIGAHLTAYGKWANQRWGVGQDNIVTMLDDPTTPTYHVVPGAASLGVTDDDYASVVLLRYPDSTAGVYKSVRSPATPSPAELAYGRRTFAVTLTDQAPMSAAAAQAFADGILAKSKGRLGWTNGLTLTSQELLTSGGVPADLSLVSEQVGTGVMVRLHGIFDDLLEYTGNTYLDIIIGEAKYADGAMAIDLNPLGMAARDLAAVVEAVTGQKAA